MFCVRCEFFSLIETLSYRDGSDNNILFTEEALKTMEIATEAFMLNIFHGLCHEVLGAASAESISALSQPIFLSKETTVIRFITSGSSTAPSVSLHPSFVSSLPLSQRHVSSSQEKVLFASCDNSVLKDSNRSSDNCATNSLAPEYLSKGEKEHSSGNCSFSSLNLNLKKNQSQSSFMSRPSKFLFAPPRPPPSFATSLPSKMIDKPEYPRGLFKGGPPPSISLENKIPCSLTQTRSRYSQQSDTWASTRSAQQLKGQSVAPSFGNNPFSTEMDEPSVPLRQRHANWVDKVNTSSNPFSLKSSADQHSSNGTTPLQHQNKPNRHFCYEKCEEDTLESTKHLKYFLTDVYTNNNPRKLADIPEILKKYKGHEEELIQKIESKYDVKYAEFKIGHSKKERKSKGSGSRRSKKSSR